MKKERPKILIEVKSSCVEALVATANVDVYLIDLDEDGPELKCFECEAVSAKAFRQYIKELKNEI